MKLYALVFSWFNAMPLFQMVSNEIVQNLNVQVGRLLDQSEESVALEHLYLETAFWVRQRKTLHTVEQTGNNLRLKMQSMTTKFRLIVNFNAS